MQEEVTLELVDSKNIDALTRRHVSFLYIELNPITSHQDQKRHHQGDYDQHKHLHLY